MISPRTLDPFLCRIFSTTTGLLYASSPSTLPQQFLLQHLTLLSQLSLGNQTIHPTHRSHARTFGRGEHSSFGGGGREDNFDFSRAISCSKKNNRKKKRNEQGEASIFDSLASVSKYLFNSNWKGTGTALYIRRRPRINRRKVEWNRNVRATRGFYSFAEKRAKPGNKQILHSASCPQI
jgi:hypothetical protein